MKNFFGGAHRRPTFRKAGRGDGFRIVAMKPGHVRRLNSRAGEVWIPKAGWVRFRWSPRRSACEVVPGSPGPVRPMACRLCRHPGRYPESWHWRGRGGDRGVVVSAALSTGELLTVPGLSPGRRRRLIGLERKLARATPGSGRRARVRLAVARLKAREADGRKDWCEKLSTDLARRFDMIRVENPGIARMTRSARGTVAEPGRNVRQKAGLNREIARSGWGLLVTRLEQKAPGRVRRSTRPTRRSAAAHAGTPQPDRESQSRFRCVACNFACNADVNAAMNIAAGQAVKARGGDRVTGPAKGEPQHAGPWSHSWNPRPPGR